VCNLARKVTHAQKRNHWANCDEFLHRCRGPRRNHLSQFLWLPRTGFRRGGGGSSFGLLRWLASSPLQHSRTTVRVCDQISYTPCSKKVSCSMYDHIFGLIFKILSPGDSWENSLCAYHKDFHLTCNMLLQYLVKVKNQKNVTKFSRWTWQLMCLTKS